MVGRIVAPVMVGTTAACSGDATTVSRAEVVDSAGIRIVTYDLTQRPAPTYRLLGEPDLEIGTLNGPAEYTFSDVAGVAVTDDGSIVVADRSARQLRVYDDAGVYRATLGGPGEGPGEFAGTPQISGLSGDTVFAYDLRSRRVTALSLDGELRGSVTLTDAGVLPTRVLRRPDGTLLLQTRWVPPVDPGLYDFRAELDSAVIERLDASGASVDTFAVLPDVRRIRSVSQRADGTFSTLQLDGLYSPRAVFVSNADDVFYGHSGSFEVRRAAADGVDATVIRVIGAEDPTPMTEVRAQQEAEMRTESDNREINRLLRLLMESLPERLPAFSDLLVSTTGDLWIARMQVDRSEGDDWLVFSRSGELRGAVHTPPATEVYAIGADYAIGVFSDELDVPYLRRYPLAEAPSVR